MAQDQTRYLHLDYATDDRVNRNLDLLDAAVQRLEHPPSFAARVQTSDGLLASEVQVGTLAVTGDATIAGTLSADTLAVPDSAFPFSVQSWTIGDPMTVPRRLSDDPQPLATLTIEEAGGCVVILTAEVTVLLRGSGLIALTLSRNGAVRKVRRIPFSLAGATVLPYSAVIPDYWTADSDAPAEWTISATALQGIPDAIFAQLSSLVVR